MYNFTTPPQSLTSGRPSWGPTGTQPPMMTPYSPSIHSIPLPHAASPHPLANSPSLHYLLEYNRSGSIIYDIRLPLTHIRTKSAQRINTHEAATVPIVQYMCIRIPGLPWIIDVRNPQGVTLENVLSVIYTTFQAIVTKEDYGILPSQLRSSATTAFHTRVSASPYERQQGLKRIDCLGHKTLFLGITRATDGSDTWDLRLSTEYL